MVVPIKLMSDRAKMPKFAHDTDAGMDLFSPSRHVIPAEGMSQVPLEIKMAVPVRHVGLIMDKSSLAIRGLHVVAGVVDAGYRGEVIVAIRNLNQAPYVIEEGTKVAQMLILPVPYMTTAQVESLDDTARGEGGFGSTGGI